MKSSSEAPVQPLLFAKREQVDSAQAIQYVGTDTEIDNK
jgi:hypothetical protein